MIIILVYLGWGEWWWWWGGCVLLYTTTEIEIQIRKTQFSEKAF